MSELVWREDNGCLGKYNDTPIYIKKGKFGLYAEWSSSKNTISLKPLNLSAEEIRLKDVVALIEKKSNTLTQEAAAELFLPQCVFGGEDDALEPILPTKQSPSDKTLLRTLRSDLSIRKGKYGPYIFHQTSAMSKPDFHPMKPIANKWQDMADLELITWITNTYRLNI
jgi:topoisomerase IA-like protein